MNRNNAAFIYLIMAIAFVLWMEWRYKRREKRDWRELQASSRIIDNATKQKIVRDAKKLEREAMEYKEVPQKKIFRSKP